MMQHNFKFIIDSRKAFIRLIDHLSVEELNHIPTGLNNNIIWNFGHIVVSTQALCYVRTGIWEDTSSIKYFNSYTKGTRPTYFVSEEEITELKRLAISSIEKIESDYNNGIFSSIQPYDTQTFGEILNSIEEVIITTIGHDNAHFGCATVQRTLIKNK